MNPEIPTDPTISEEELNKKSSNELPKLTWEKFKTIPILLEPPNEAGWPKYGTEVVRC